MNANNANITGHYEITAYQGRCIYLEICPSPPALRGGDWFWHANDGCSDVGPFFTRDAAVAHSKKSIASYRGLKVLSVVETTANAAVGS